ncbi:MAG: QueT transporter family protein [Lachnospiraceae bacterium]|nr:QueT transporter family protein [Lachnospiraceae bacterium]
MNKKTTSIVHAAVIAALYVVLTLIANALGLANHAIQIRFSEALTILPLFTPAAIPGLFVGCILANFMTGCLPWDIVFGSLATLLGALGTYALGTYTLGSSAPAKQYPILAVIPPILSNTLIVPFVLAYVYRFEGSIPYFMLTVGIGEVLSCGVLGMLLYRTLAKYRKNIF